MVLRQYLDNFGWLGHVREGLGSDMGCARKVLETSFIDGGTKLIYNIDKTFFFLERRRKKEEKRENKAWIQARKRGEGTFFPPVEPFEELSLFLIAFSLSLSFSLLSLLRTHTELEKRPFFLFSHLLPPPLVT